MSNTIEIKMSKSGHPSPLIDSVHLHSIYNPIKEAEAFARSNERKLTSPNIMIFGLGFGYHVAAIEKRLQHLFANDYQIVVIEPNHNLVKMWKELKPAILSTRVRIVNYLEPKKYFDDKLLTDFLISKPAIISHNASFQLNEAFYKDFMSFSYPSDLLSSSSFVENESLSDYLKSNHEESSSCEELIKNVCNKNEFKSWDYLTMALNNIIGKN